MNYDSNTAVVAQTQKAINAAGYSPQLVTDGKYGPLTKAGVVWFQKQHGLTQDGVIGPATVAATISPTPAAAAAPSTPDFLAGTNWALAAQTAAGIKSTGAGATLISTPVIHLALTTPLAAPSLSALPSSLSSVIPTVIPPSIVSAATSDASNLLVPAGIGAAAGLVIGFLSSGVMWALLGGGVGVAAGYAYYKLKSPAASTIAGEADFGIDFGLDDDCIVAGEIGVPTSYTSMKG